MTRSRVWRPFTQHAVEPPPPVAVRSEGAYIETADGRRILDAIASWWVITHGHRQPAIMAAIREAADQLDQVIFASFTHPAAEALADGLAALAPAGLEHVFYSDSGSTAVEVALKMALGFHRHTGAGHRDRIAVLQNAYHGDTIGAMSVGERGVFNAAYEPLMFGVDTLPWPAPGAEQTTLDAFEALARQGRLAALILEPLILGAGGMLFYSPAALAELKRIAERHGVLFIADEVMTGWGRTGTLFACEQAGVAPDILCTSKGLTGGAVPLAATLATDAIYQAHFSTDRARTFFHSSSYTANPIACAAGLANLQVWREEPVQARIDGLNRVQSRWMQTLAAHPGFSGARVCGTLAAVEVKSPASGYLAAVGLKLRAAFARRDILIRPLGDTVYVMPPYCTTEQDLDRLYTALIEIVETEL